MGGAEFLLDSKPQNSNRIPSHYQFEYQKTTFNEALVQMQILGQKGANQNKKGPKQQGLIFLYCQSYFSNEYQTSSLYSKFQEKGRADVRTDGRVNGGEFLGFAQFTKSMNKSCSKNWQYAVIVRQNFGSFYPVWDTKTKGKFSLKIICLYISNKPPQIKFLRFSDVLELFCCFYPP